MVTGLNIKQEKLYEKLCTEIKATVARIYQEEDKLFTEGELLPVTHVNPLPFIEIIYGKNRKVILFTAGKE